MTITNLNHSLSGYIAVVMNFLFPFIVIPILCYRFSNWLLLVGIPFVYMGQLIASDEKTKYSVLIALVAGCCFYWIHTGFDLQREITFYLCCFSFGFIGYPLNRAIRFRNISSGVSIEVHDNKGEQEDTAEKVETGLETQQTF